VQTLTRLLVNLQAVRPNITKAEQFLTNQQPNSVIQHGQTDSIFDPSYGLFFEVL
jgi:hypothetical protein